MVRCRKRIQTREEDIENDLLVSTYSHTVIFFLHTEQKHVYVLMIVERMNVLSKQANKQLHICTVYMQDGTNRKKSTPDRY